LRVFAIKFDLPSTVAETLKGMDTLIHGIAAGGTIRTLAATTTDITIEAVRRHQTSPTVSAALGRVMTGTLLLASTLKDLERVTAKIECDGPVGGIIAEATADGTVRGYVKNPLAESPVRSDGKFDVAGVIGGGMFHIIREYGSGFGLRTDPYVGSVPITSGEIAEDFAYYLAKSEQIPSAMLLGVLLQNSEPFVSAAGGVLIQMMPGANEHIITMIEDTIAHAPHLTTAIKEGATPFDLLKLVLGVIDFEVLEEKPVVFKCNCSQERAAETIMALGREEIRSMIENDKGASMSCGFCNETYSISEDDLRNLIENA